MINKYHTRSKKLKTSKAILWPTYKYWPLTISDIALIKGQMRRRRLKHLLHAVYDIPLPFVFK